MVSLALTLLVRSRFGEETFLCDGSTCVLGSGTRWLLTGVAVLGTFIGTAGFRWSSMLERRGSLDPLAKWPVPDAEQILEILSVIGAGVATYWLLLNGPSIESVDVRQVNEWANDVRNFRLEENTASTNLVPSRQTWFLIGGVLSLPFAFSFGAMVGREFFGRRRRKAMKAANAQARADFDAHEAAANAGRERDAGDQDSEFPTPPMLARASIDLGEDDALEEFDLDRFEIELDNELDEALDADDS